MKMKITLLAIAILLTACSSPDDIVLGPEPLKQMADQGDKFKRMSEEDRMLLSSYLMLGQMSAAMGGQVKPNTGRTVGEVMKDAKAWKEKMKAAQVEQGKRDAEALALQARVDAEQKKIAERIAAMVTIAVTDKVVLPKNYDVGRYSELLMIQYALENKSEKTIRQIKGAVTFVDATGDEVGRLNVDINSVIKPGATIKTDTGSGWRTNSYSNGNIEKIANREFSSMKGSFKATSIAFDGGEVIKASD
jgi:hypothetical protein